MKYAVGGYILGGMVLLMVAGCDTSESGPSDESSLAGEDRPLKSNEVGETIRAPFEVDLKDYVKTVEAKLGQLQYKHIKLVDRIQPAELESESQTAFDTNLETLTRKREEISREIKALKTGKGKDLHALQLGMNLALEDLAHLYETALAQFSG
jgi:hypothetical protein